MDAPDTPTMTKPRRRWLALSVRGMLALVLVLGLWLGWVVHEARQQRQAVAAVEQFGGWVHYDYEFVPGPVAVPRGNNLWATTWGKLTPGRSPWAPTWLRRTLGDEYFRDLAHVSLFVDIQKGEAHADPYNKGPADAVLEKLGSQTGIRTLQIGGQQATDAGMRHVGRMAGLEELIIFPAHEITDAGLAHLGGLKNLRVVLITNSKMTDEGLRHLGGLTGVEQLMLDGQSFSDRGLAYLKGLTRLRRLSLGRGRHEITDAGLASLKGLRDLESLDLSGTRVTDLGLEQLRGLERLKEIAVEGTSITKEGRDRFRASMPNLKKIE
jgi:hypothetical protein